MNDSNRFPGPGHCHVDVGQRIFFMSDDLQIRYVYGETGALEGSPFPKNDFADRMLVNFKLKFPVTG